MTGLGVDRAVSVGHCMGACVAQRLALDHPGRVLGVVAQIAGARLAIYRHAGHSLHGEEPDRFAADVVEFVAGVTGRAADAALPVGAAA